MINPYERLEGKMDPETLGRGPCEDRGRQRSDASTSQSLPGATRIEKGHLEESQSFNPADALILASSL